MAEREYTDYDDWMRAGGDPTYGQGVTQPPPSPAAPSPVRETPSDQAPKPQTREAEPWWWDYNGGSPPSAPLGGGMQGWNWDGSRWWQTPNPTTPAPTPVEPPPPRPGGGGGSGPGAVAPVPSGGGGGVSSQLPGDVLSLFNRQPEKTPVQSAYQDALLKYMNRGQQTPSLDDPILGPQAEVFRVAQQRNQERNRRSLAERASATGQGQSGYLDRQINQGVQQQGMNTASFNANLLGGEMNKRREELLAALQLASSTGNQEATRELQAKLAQVQTMMQQQGLNLQDKLGSGDLALRAWLGQMGNDQFYDQLGVNTSMGMEGLNQRALQIIMGGTS